MPTYRYAVLGLDPDKTAIASGRNMRCSPKHSREICKTIRGMMLDKAIELLESVIEQKAWIPYRRFSKGRGHHPAMKKWPIGGHPVNASTQILRVLKNAESNADSKGLDIDRLKIVHAVTQKGRVFENIIPRAFGRSSAYNEESSHVEIVLEEVA